MKLALVTETYPPEINGVAMTLSQLVAGLRERGHHVQVVKPIPSHSNAEPHTNPEELTVWGLPIPRYPDLRFGLFCRNRLIDAWTRNRPDVVHVATEGPLGLSAIQAASRLGIPSTSTFHTNFHSYSEHYNARFATRLILAFLRWIHNRTQCTMAPTKELADQLTSEGFKNMAVFGRGVNLSVFNPSARSKTLRESWGAVESDPVFVHVSRLAAEKNYELLERTYRAVLDEVPNAKFVVVGGGPLAEELKARMPFAIHTGPIPLEDRPALARIYASADIFCYPSHTETYGNVTTEAMASGNAVVAFDYAAAALHIRNEENGYVIPLDDDQQFIDRSVRLARDLALARSIGITASQYAKAFDWNPVVNTFEGLLERYRQETLPRN